MKNEKLKQEMIAAVDIMIQHADKGPSGFWVDDHEGCGNPEVFPEFAQGLKRGALVQKRHCLCPWDRAVLFGSGEENLASGCYYRCSIQEARNLSPQMLEEILRRFKKRLISDDYDEQKDIKPLLTEGEKVFIKKTKEAEDRNKARTCKQQEAKVSCAAKKLIEKYGEDQEIVRMLLGNYQQEVTVQCEDGALNFSPSRMKDIVGGKKLTYNDYLELQIDSWHKCRKGFEWVYYGGMGFGNFKGEIEQVKEKRVCFKRIYICGMYPDGEYFEGKEDHVWMDRTGFEKFGVGDNLEFFAEVYRYIKTGKGKELDYGLRNPEGITRIEEYPLPTEEEQARKTVEQILCDGCYLKNSCFGVCFRSKEKEAAIAGAASLLRYGSKT